MKAELGEVEQEEVSRSIKTKGKKARGKEVSKNKLGGSQGESGARKGSVRQLDINISTIFDFNTRIFSVINYYQSMSDIKDDKPSQLKIRLILTILQNGYYQSYFDLIK